MITIRTPLNRTNDRWMSTPDLNSQHIYQPTVPFAATVSAGCCGCSLVTRFLAATCRPSLHTSVLLSRNLTFSPHHMSGEPGPNVLQNGAELLRTAQSSAWMLGTMLGQRAELCSQKLESRRGRVHSERTSKKTHNKSALGFSRHLQVFPRYCLLVF